MADSAVRDDILTCPCSCCVEQVNRELHGRFAPWHWCDLFEDGGGCECAYCAATVPHGRSGPEQPLARSEES